MISQECTLKACYVHYIKYVSFVFLIMCDQLVHNVGFTDLCNTNVRIVANRNTSEMGTRTRKMTNSISI